MADKQRSVNTHFWDDNYIRKLSRDEKLLYLYFLTNPLTNLSGIYEISIDRISFDTGITEQTVRKALKHFESESKIIYIDGYIIIKKFLKNQKMNNNMKKSVVKSIENLPESISTLIFGDLDNDSKAFESLRNTLLKWKGKKESEIESENEDEITEKISENQAAFIYSLYPRKQGKSDGIKKLCKIDADMYDLILSKCKEYAEYTKGTDKQYIKQFATWVNQKSWEDEYEKKDGEDGIIRSSI